MKVKGERIVVFGDSTSKHGADNSPEIWDVDQGSDRISGQPGDLLASLLLEAGAEAVRVNARVGRSAHNFWGREDANALLGSDTQFGPTKVVVILGTNDIGLTPSVDQADMQRIVDYYQGLGAEVWGVGPWMYVDNNLNAQADTVTAWMADVFGGKFIDPRPFTSVFGRAGDGVHFGADSARTTAVALASALADQSSLGFKSGWLPWAVAAGGLLIGGLVYARWHRKRQLAGLDDSEPIEGLDRVNIVDGKRYDGSENALVRSGAAEVPCKSGLDRQARCWTKKRVIDLGADEPTRRTRKRKAKPAHEVQLERLETLQARMADAIPDPAWLDTDINQIEGWISVDAELPDREWLKVAQDQLLDQNVLPEHAGAAPADVYRWNDAFISTYRMLIDDGVDHAEAVNSARQNANDTVRLSGAEHALTKADPSLYTKKRVIDLGADEPIKPKRKRKPRRSPEYKALEAQLQQLYSQGSYAGNTPEQSREIYEEIKAVQAKLTALDK